MGLTSFNDISNRSMEYITMDDRIKCMEISSLVMEKQFIELDLGDVLPGDIKIVSGGMEPI
jgi:hypothetical protein